MKTMRKSISKIIIMLFVIALVATPIVYTNIPSVFARTNAELANDKKKLIDDQNKLEKSQKEYDEALSKLEENKASVEEQKTILDKQMQDTQKRITSLNKIISELDGQLAEQNEQLEVSSKAMESYYTLYKERIRENYEEGEKSTLSAIFGSKSFTDFFKKAEVASQIMEYDNQLMDKMTAEINKIKTLKAGIEENKAQNESSKSLVVIQKISLDDQIAKSNALIKLLQSDVALYTQKQKDAEVMQAGILDGLAKIAAESKKNNAINNVPSYPHEPGDYIWPTPGFKHISSNFGSRIDPISGVRKTHWGTDISGAGIFGTPVYAMKGGVVIYSTWNFSGGGNMTSIDHGNGVVTTYMHQNEREVVVGQVVKQGEEIGKVGTTGNSTGPHLHMEFMVDGVRVDPMGFFN